MKFSILLAFIFLCYSNSPIEFNNTTWELAKSKNNIRVFTRSYAGSEIQEFKALTSTNKNSKLLENLIDNVEEYPEWQLNLASAKILKQVSPREQYVWYSIEVPWPFTNRDVVVHTLKSMDANGVLTYQISSAPDYIEEKEDLIRIRDASGKWQFTPNPNGEIEVLYQFYADPAGSLPNWVINMFIVDAPYQTFLNLQSSIGDR